MYIRELLQNAIDAISARQLLDVNAPGSLLIIPADVSDDGALHCVDTGVGLTLDEVTRFLATIGSSSKRDELGFARSQFIGQFGIGLLSCFLVSDTIEVFTQSMRGGPLVRWFGSGDGTYTAEEIDDAAAAEIRARWPVANPSSTNPLDPSPAPDNPPAVNTSAATDQTTDPAVTSATEQNHTNRPIGTWVRLTPRPGAADWLASSTVTTVATTYGQMLDIAVDVKQIDGKLRRISGELTPWSAAPSDVFHRQAAQLRIESLLSVRALSAIPVNVPEAGLSGMAIILGQPAVGSDRQAHRVYAKGMLVGTAITGLLPEWAFFARLIVNTENLRLTASREALYEDDLLEQVRLSLGDQIRRWIVRTANVDSELFTKFLELHSLAVRAMAVHDTQLLDVVVPWLNLETTAGVMTLPEIVERFGMVRFTRTVDEYRQIAPVAAAQGLGVVNAGYVYEADLIVKYAEHAGNIHIQALDPGDLSAHVEPLPAEILLRMQPFLTTVGRVLERADVVVEMRTFQPATLPGLVLDNRLAQQRRSSRAAATGDDVWSQALKDIDDGGDDRRQFLLNYQHPTVRHVADLPDPGLQALAIESLYCQALLLGRHQLRPVDTALLDRSFRGLLDKAIETGEPKLPPNDEDM